MNRLPQELVEKISSYLSKSDLKRVLTLTRKFQYAAERYSGAFAEYTLPVNPRHSQKFVALYSGHRLPLLQEVIFAFTLNLEDVEESCRQSVDGVRKKDEMFTSDLNFLFTTLKSVEEQARENEVYGRYRLSIYCPTYVIGYGDCPHQSYVSWRIHLLNSAEMPQINSVRSLELHNNQEEIKGHFSSYGKQGDMKLDLRIIIDLAMKLPNLEYVAFRTGGFEWCPTLPQEQPSYHYQHDWEGPRRDARQNFASTIASSSASLPNSLRRASLDFLNPLDRSIDIHHNKRLPNFVGNLKADPFSSSLRVLTNGLRELQLRAMIDESFFMADSNIELFWPSLEVLEVAFHPARPDGKWYFQGPGGEGRDDIGFDITDECYPPYEKSELDEEMDKLYEESDNDTRNGNHYQFRIIPHQKNIKPLLEGFAKAAIRMSSLRKALIWSPLSWYWSRLYSDDESDEDSNEVNFGRHHIGECDVYAWGIAYSKPGLTKNSVPSRQLRWMVAQWRPDAELHNLFQQIGREKHGEELEEIWPLDSEHELATYRDESFEEFMFCDDPGCILPPS